MLKRVLSCLAGVLLLGLAGCKPEVHDIHNEYYYGVVEWNGIAYAVSISESQNTLGFVRRVELRQSGDQFKTISGISANGGDITDWWRLSYCGPRKTGDVASGCNAVERQDKGWKFNPCPSDIGKVLPFTAEDITRAQFLLGFAIRSVRIPQNLTVQEAWDPVAKKVRSLYPFPETK